MDIMELGAIGELVGGVAVIASLIFVGFQLRATTTTLRATSGYDGLRNFQDLNYIALADPKLAGEDLDLDDAERAQLQVLWRSALQHMAAQQYLHERGLFDDALWQQYIDYARALVRSPVASDWWVNEQRIAPYPPQFLSQVNEGR